MLGCIQPMSSPMMKRMLGFCCCCAAAGILATTPTATNATRADQSFRMSFMQNLLTFQGSWERANEQPHRELLYCRGQQSSRVTADSNDAGPVSAMQMGKARAAARAANGSERGDRADLVDSSGCRVYQHNLTTSYNQSADDVRNSLSSGSRRDRVACR